MDTARARIRIEREDAPVVDSLRAYKVFIDGTERTAVRNGDTAVVEVDPGTHTVQLKISWCRSPQIEVDVSPGCETHFFCRPGVNQFDALYYIIFALGRYISLRRVESQ